MIPNEVKSSQQEKTKEKNPEPMSFSSLPDEIVENCLARISKWNYPPLSLVSKKFLSFLSSPELYATRSHIGTTEPCLYFCLKFPENESLSWFTLWMKPPADDEALIDEHHHPPDNYSLVPVPPPSSSSSHSDDYYYFGTVAVGSEIYQIGAPYDAPPCSSVRILDCRNHTWRVGPSMMVARACPSAVYLDEKIYVIGGCGEGESWMEVFDVKTQTWKPLPSHEAVAEEVKREHFLSINELQGKIYAIAELKHYTYDPKEGTWEVVGTHSSFAICPYYWCVIENVMYCYTNQGYCMWYDSKIGEWREVESVHLVHLESLGDSFMRVVRGIHNYGGKLFVVWTSWYEYNIGPRDWRERIWVAKISFEKNHDGGEIWGKKEWVKELKVPRDYCCPESYKFLNCAVVSI